MNLDRAGSAAVRQRSKQKNQAPAFDDFDKNVDNFPDEDSPGFLDRARIEMTNFREEAQAKFRTVTNPVKLKKWGGHLGRLAIYLAIVYALWSLYYWALLTAAVNIRGDSYQDLPSKYSRPANPTEVYPWTVVSARR